MRFVVAVVVSSLFVACGPPVDPFLPDDDEFVSIDTGTPATDVFGAEGGTLSTTQDGVTYTLTVPPGALVDDVEISMTPARIEDVEGSLGARFEPDGLELLVPATLTVVPGPVGDVVVSIQDGPFPVEAGLAIPLADRVVFAVPHFSTHAAANAGNVLGRALPADVRQAVAGLTGLTREEVAAVAIGVFFRTHVEPLMPLVTRDVHGFDLASAAAGPWFQVVNEAGDDVRALPHVQGGTETVTALSATLQNDLLTAGTDFYTRLTPPACTGTPDILGVLDWGRFSVLVQNRLEALGAPVAFATCLTSRVRVEGPASMTSTDRELHFTLHHEVRGPSTDPRTVPDEAVFFLSALGATGPSTITDGNGGDVRDVEFIREPGDERARVVTLTVDAQSVRAQINAVPPPTPVTHTVTEDGTSLSLTATPSTLASSGETSAVCATLLVDNQPRDSFLVNFSVEGPGGVDINVFETSTGAACVNYIPPAPLPQNGAEVMVHALVAVAGGELRQSTEIELGAGGLQVALTASPETVESAGETSSVCATVTSGGAPVTSYDVQFARSGPGALSEVAVISVSSPDGRACVDWTAPTPFVDEATAIVSAHVTTGGLSADGSVEIELQEGELPPATIYDGSWVGAGTYTWTHSVDNSSPDDASVTTQSGSATFDVSCGLSPPPDAFLNRISNCVIANHIGTASYTITRLRGPYMCEALSEVGGTCTNSSNCFGQDQCLSVPGLDDRCAVCVGTGFTDELTTFDDAFNFDTVASPNNFFQVLADGGATTVFWQNLRAPILGHFSSTMTCSISGPDCSESTAEPETNNETDLSALELPSVVFTQAMGEQPATLVPGGTLAGTIDMAIGAVTFELHHVP